MPDIASKVALEVRNRYVLGFSAGDVAHDGKVHRLRVQLRFENFLETILSSSGKIAQAWLAAPCNTN